MNVGRRMSRPVITVQPNTPITKVHELMAHEKIHQTPVVKNGKLVGIVSDKDLLKGTHPRSPPCRFGKSPPWWKKLKSKTSW